MDLSNTLAIGQILIWVGVIAYYIFVYKSKIDNIEKKLVKIDKIDKIDEIEKKVNKIDQSVQVIEERIDKINDIEKGLKSVTAYIRDLSGYLKEWKTVPAHLQNFDNYYNSNSPLKLTEKGVNFVQESEFDEVFRKNKSFFLGTLEERLKGKENDKAFFYFCEEYSIQFIHELEENESDLLSEVRGYIFKEGLYDLKETLFKVLGLYLRDHVIAAFNKATEFKKLKAKKNEKNP